jgi:crotonobetainyl-CoA:carnitine CoA-transferase CaiB-like acyl-CoA transferase
MHAPFKNLKVIEFASVLAGPAVGMFFAELGAEVIKIENKPTGGDVTRTWRLPSESQEKPYSAYFCSVNWQKKHFFLDLNDKNDLDKVLEWIAEADIVVSNFKISSAKTMGVDYETLQKINPKLIYAQLTSFGEDDESPAFDIVLQAEAGFLYMSGEAEREPTRMPVALIDLLAAHQLKEAILIALLERTTTGKGAYVTTSLLESAVASLANQATNWLMEEHIPERMGSMHPNIAPYGDVFYSSDEKPIVLAIGTERQFFNLCKVLNISSLVEDVRFSKNAERVKNRVALRTVLQDAFTNFEQQYLLDTFKAQGVPAGKIRNMKEVFEQPKAQKMILEEKMEDGTWSKRVKTVAFEITRQS